MLSLTLCIKLLELQIISHLIDKHYFTFPIEFQIRYVLSNMKSLGFFSLSLFRNEAVSPTPTPACGVLYRAMCSTESIPLQFTVGLVGVWQMSAILLCSKLRAPFQRPVYWQPLIGSDLKVFL